MKTERQIADVVFRNSFGAFCCRAFKVLHPGQQLIHNWHIDAVCHAIEQMVTGEGEKRLVLNQPPRTLKSYIVSVCLPAWVLGRNPGARIICASYSEDLACKFSRDCCALIFYKRVFPRTRLNPKKSTETEFETIRRGYRLATSVGGTLTGRGGDILIVDHPIKANDANSQVALTGADEWCHNTALNVARGHWTVLQMRDRIKTLVRLQMLREEQLLNVIGRRSGYAVTRWTGEVPDSAKFLRRRQTPPCWCDSLELRAHHNRWEINDFPTVRRDDGKALDQIEEVRRVAHGRDALRNLQ